MSNPKTNQTKFPGTGDELRSLRISGRQDTKPSARCKFRQV